MLDTHVHLDLLDDPRALVDAVAAGVSAMIGIGIDPFAPGTPHIEVPAGLELHHTVGLHPQELDRTVEQRGDLDGALEALRRRVLDAEASERPIAVGESGLDARTGMPDLELQRRAFVAHLDLAADAGLPLVLHGVRRDGAVLGALDRHADARGARVPFVWHGFSSSRDTMKQAVQRGGYISVGFVVLNDKARRLLDAVADIPADRLVVETDAPPLAPARLVDVIARVAQLRGEAPEQLARRAEENARRLFRLPAAAAAPAAT